MTWLGPHCATRISSCESSALWHECNNSTSRVRKVNDGTTQIVVHRTVRYAQVFVSGHCGSRCPAYRSLLNVRSRSREIDHERAVPFVRKIARMSFDEMSGVGDSRNGVMNNCTRSVTRGSSQMSTLMGDARRNRDLETKNAHQLLAAGCPRRSAQSTVSPSQSMCAPCVPSTSSQPLWPPGADARALGFESLAAHAASTPLLIERRGQRDRPSNGTHRAYGPCRNWTATSCRPCRSPPSHCCSVPRPHRWSAPQTIEERRDARPVRLRKEYEAPVRTCSELGFRLSVSSFVVLRLM